MDITVYTSDKDTLMHFILKRNWALTFLHVKVFVCVFISSIIFAVDEVL